MFQGFSQCVLTVSLLYFGPFNPFYCSPLPFYLPPLIFQLLSIHILIASTFTDVMFYNIVDAPWPPQSSFTITNVFYIWVSIWSCLFLFIWLSFGSIFHLWEKKCCLCLSEPGLLHLTWYPPTASTYFPTICHYSFGWVKLHCSTHFLLPYWDD
jgi:hypothetical protein